MSYKEPFNPDVDGEAQAIVADNSTGREDRSNIAHYQESPTADAVAALVTAITDDATIQIVLDAIPNPVNLSGGTQKVTATAGGTAADIKAIQVHVYGTNAADANIDEALPAFTVNTAGTVTSTLLFKTITKIAIPVHDGIGATTSVGIVGDVDAILPAETDVGTAITITEVTHQPDVPRCVSATAGGTAGDIKAIQVIVVGTNAADAAITETLPAFTVNTAGSVTGAKAFKTITRVTIPVHDGTGATTSIGDSDILGLNHKLPHNTVIFAALNNAREGTAPTVVASATAIESNTADLNSALDGNAVDIYYIKP